MNELNENSNNIFIIIIDGFKFGIIELEFWLYSQIDLELLHFQCNYFNVIIIVATWFYLSTIDV